VSTSKEIIEKLYVDPLNNDLILLKPIAFQ